MEMEEEREAEWSLEEILRTLRSNQDSIQEIKNILTGLLPRHSSIHEQNLNPFLLDDLSTCPSFRRSLKALT